MTVFPPSAFCDMKKISLFIMVLTLALGQACKGPVGPEGLPGPQGTPGDPGGIEYSKVFDVEGDFTAAGEYAFTFVFPPEEIEVFETDLVLVYIRWGTTTDDDALPIWRLLPQSVIFDEGLLQYNFEHTFVNVWIFLEAQFDLAGLDPEWTAGQVFRVVIVPGESGSGKLSGPPVDFKNYEEVMRHFKISDKKVPKYKVE